MERLRTLAEEDGRFALEAYLFVYDALPVAQKLHGRERHVSGRELLDGIRVLAQERYGRMAKLVLNSWGVKATDDFGAIVFNLVNSGLMSKTEEDKVEEFHSVYDFDRAFVDSYQIPDPESGS
ncbi:MAG: hypothetical protein JSU73_02370 [candidate division WOR-3 bacterium]|nr:MAG: hypothetical protein JSU73_02370 [candidate division WOR-3 bacterium]